ncbi:MAG: tellurite resistance TerB family protein [Alphaproteobacteria bacterium]|nr:tellurite resistance TerB family protein [Alphaproteobacteria bacterium]
MDPTRLINSFLGGGAGAPGASGGQPQQPARSGGPGGLDMRSLAAGAAAGGLAGFMLNSSGGRRMRRQAMRAGRTAAGLGGLALVGGLAYKAYSDHKARQAQGGAQAVPQQLAPPPPDSGFTASGDTEEGQRVGALILHAMIAAAHADGVMDAAEQAKVFDRLGQTELTAEEKAFLMDALRAPKSIDQLIGEATTPEIALEVYTASVMAIEIDTPEERAYLDTLRDRLGIEAGLAGEIESAVAAQAA